MKSEIKNILQENNKVNKEIQQKYLPVIEKIARTIINCYKKGGKVIFFGNGGSAADAQHLATELVCRFYLERKALPALSFNTNTSLLTAQGNDYGYETVFARQVEALVDKKDVVIGITTSGNSDNVLEAIKMANKIGATTIGFSGGAGGQLINLAKINFVVPAKSTPRIQEMHIVVGHIICELVEKKLFGKKTGVKV